MAIKPSKIKNSNDKNNISSKKLLIIGNGFDLHQKLSSSFKDFLNSNQYFTKFISSNSDFSAQLKYLEYISNGNDKKITPKEYIKMTTECLFYFSKHYSPIIPIDKGANFWASYFHSLKSFPQFSDGNSTFKFQSSFQSLKNWSDIEYQISYLLKNTEKILSSFNSIAKLDSGFKETNDKNIQNSLNEYESKYLKNNKFTFNSAIALMTINCSLRSGWNPKEENIYSFLFKELRKFEGMFGDYLRSQVKNAKKNNKYTEKSQQFAEKLANNSNYSLLNFNYTTFYNINDHNKTNIHSTLEEGGHPIFGISSDLGNNELIYQKPYYRFSKAYRIMKLTNDNSIKNILPKDIDEIIFYGQSLSQADYLYFDTIFTEYDIYNSDIKITFKYSADFGDKDKIEQNQFSIIYRLINQFSENINISNLLPKLLLENRLNIEEVNDDDAKKTSTD